jgi:hypothetical protein
VALQGLPASRSLRSPNGHNTLRGELGTLSARVDSGQLNLQSFIPLLTKIVDKALDAEIWKAASELVQRRRASFDQNQVPRR